MYKIAVKGSYIYNKSVIHSLHYSTHKYFIVDIVST